MRDDELLERMSEIMDQKLEPIKGAVELRTESAETKRAVEELRTESAETKRAVEELRTESAETKRTVENMQVQFEDMKQSMKKMSVMMEYDVMPRLNTIESCYTSTYRRYSESIQEHDAMKEKLEVLDSVVEKHSEKIYDLENRPA